jgi:hypothetical protein
VVGLREGAEDGGGAEGMGRRWIWRGLLIGLELWWWGGEKGPKMDVEGFIDKPPTFWTPMVITTLLPWWGQLVS